MNKEMRFAIFCLESYKVYRSLSGKEVVKLFEKYNVFDYLTEFFDVLHTTGESYINHDIDLYLQARGMELLQAVN